LVKRDSHPRWTNLIKKFLISNFIYIQFENLSKVTLARGMHFPWYEVCVLISTLTFKKLTHKTSQMISTFFQRQIHNAWGINSLSHMALSAIFPSELNKYTSFQIASLSPHSGAQRWSEWVRECVRDSLFIIGSRGLWLFSPARTHSSLWLRASLWIYTCVKGNRVRAMNY